MKVGLRLRRRIFEVHGTGELPFQRFIWLDTDKRDMESQVQERDLEIWNRLRFKDRSLLDLSLQSAAIRGMRRMPQRYPWVWSSISPRTLANMGEDAAATDGAGQMRALGRLAFAAHSDEFMQRFEREYRLLSEPGVDADARRLNFELESEVEVVFVCSLAGGTGSGCFIDAARAIRDRFQDINISAYLLMPNVFRHVFARKPQNWQDVQANAFAALRELCALSAANNRSGQGPPLRLQGNRTIETYGLPFKEVFLIDSDNEDGVHQADPNDTFEMVADALFLDLEQSEFGTRKRSDRCNSRYHLSGYTQYPIPVDREDYYANPTEAPRYVFLLPNAFASSGRHGSSLIGIGCAVRWVRGSSRRCWVFSSVSETH